MKYVIEQSYRANIFSIYPDENPDSHYMAVGMAHKFIFDNKEDAIKKACEVVTSSINWSGSGANSDIKSIKIYQSKSQFKNEQITDMIKDDIVRDNTNVEDFANRVEKYKMENN